MADPSRRAPIVAPERLVPRRLGRRVRPDRRMGVGEVITRFLDETQSTSKEQTFLEALTAALHVVMPISAVELTTARRVSSTAPVIGLSLITVPIGRGLSDPGGALQVRTAAGYTPDPWDLDLLQTIVRVFAAIRDRAGGGPALEPRGPHAWKSGDTPSVSLLGATEPMVAVRRAIDRFAATDFTVLIQGETGTGKELVARALHASSRRRHGPFVAVNCAALVDSLLEAELFGIEDRTATGVQGRPGKFELADHGTLFLDEVADLSTRAQAALLRALQSLTIERVGGHRSRHVDTRLVVATNRPLSRLVPRRQFRADLFYRLSALEIVIPPLRDRPADIGRLAEHFLARHGAARVTLSRQALDTLVAYAWPGNVRELERVIQRALAWTDGPEVQVDALPAHLQRPREDVRGESSLRAWTARRVVAVLRQCGGNKRLACLRLGISYHTLQAHLGKWGVRQHRRAA